MMRLQLLWFDFNRMLLINDLFFNSSVVAQGVIKLGAPRAQHLGLNCICKICEDVQHEEGNNDCLKNFNIIMEIIYCTYIIRLLVLRLEK